MTVKRHCKSPKICWINVFRGLHTRPRTIKRKTLRPRSFKQTITCSTSRLKQSSLNLPLVRKLWKDTKLPFVVDKNDLKKKSDQRETLLTTVKSITPSIGPDGQVVTLLGFWCITKNRPTNIKAIKINLVNVPTCHSILKSSRINIETFSKITGQKRL